MSIHTGDICPDIIAVPESLVSERPLLNLLDNDSLLLASSQLEEIAAGVREKFDFFDPNALPEQDDEEMDFGENEFYRKYSRSPKRLKKDMENFHQFNCAGRIRSKSRSQNNRPEK